MAKNRLTKNEAFRGQKIADKPDRLPEEIYWRPAGQNRLANALFISALGAWQCPVAGNDDGHDIVRVLHRL